MGFLFRLYINQLLKGNPFVVGFTIIAALAVSVGPFYEGLSRGEARSIGFAIFILVLVLILLAVAIADRLSDPDRKKRKAPPRSGR